MMSWRPIRPVDLEECLRINPKGMGHEFVGRVRALAAWQWLLKARSFQAAVVESDVPIKGHRIVGFAASVFVSAAFAEGEAADPKPGLNARLISSIASDEAVILAAKELGYANAQGNLYLIVLQPCSVLHVLTPQQYQGVVSEVTLSCLYYHDGYQVRMVLSEATIATEIECMNSAPIWKVQSTFEDFHRHNPGNTWNRDRILFRLQLADRPYFLVDGHRREPVLRLRDSDQELLAAALKGSTDMELSQELRLKLPTVKKRWASVFDRVAAAKPDLLPGLDDNLDRQARGRQKRHRLLAYVREHPEELRPFLYSTMSPKRPSYKSSGSFASRRN
jgi:hypothetical protein